MRKNIKTENTNNEDDFFGKNMDEKDMFSEVGSMDFLNFSFQDKSYAKEIIKQTTSTGKFCAITCSLRKFGNHNVLYLEHEYNFFGGSLGCAEGEKLCLGFEWARVKKIPVIVNCKSGGARMQEGTLSLMQMAKVSVAVQALKQENIPYISVCSDPTYGGVSASYAMQGDIRIGIKGARVGFAGPAVILNTVFKMDQAAYDIIAPEGFQTSEFCQKYGQLDLVIEETQLNDTIIQILDIISKKKKGSDIEISIPEDVRQVAMKSKPFVKHDFTLSRVSSRIQSRDLINLLFDQFLELKGDGMINSDSCLVGGIALFHNMPVVIIGTCKGHKGDEFEKYNYGMPCPTGYRVAKRLMLFADHFKIPIISLVDTCGAYPSFDSEKNGQSEALATNFTTMSFLSVPIFTIILGEGGSGGALAIAMGNKIAMLSNAYYGVISPEGGTSILGRYTDEEDKKRRFNDDCRKLANIQQVYADNLKELGVIDEIIAEDDDEDYQNCPNLIKRIDFFLLTSFEEVKNWSEQNIRAERYNKFRNMGKRNINWKAISSDERKGSKASLNVGGRKKKRLDMPTAPRTLQFIGNIILNSEHSSFSGKKPKGVCSDSPGYLHAKFNECQELDRTITFKEILDESGPKAVADSVRKNKKVLITDTTMRDAHQSLLATRIRTIDILGAAEEVSVQMNSAFSLEMWGGATFDVSYRFLYEDPWVRLRLLRKKIPNILFQMLLRGSNAVGYKNYPDNVIIRFIELAADNGIDVFRIFDCFNNLDQMMVSIKTVLRKNKIANVAICFSGDFLNPNEKIYTLKYYSDLAKSYKEVGAHMISIKDMAGLVKPQHAKPLIKAIRSQCDLPIHFHTHNTSSTSLATCIEISNAGCDIIDFAIASMSDTTSQPSLNAFLAAMEGDPRCPDLLYLNLERLDMYWTRVRGLYSHFESGLKCGTARVYDHQIPGGQYSNLITQAKSLNRFHLWEKIVDTYRDVNQMLGDIIKVTPSSKCVGDMALYMVTNNLTCDDVLMSDNINWPESVKQLFRGDIGFPHHGLNSEIAKKILNSKTDKQLTRRPGLLLPPVDFEAEKERLESKYVTQLSEEEVISAVLYPEVFDDYMVYVKSYGNTIIYLPTSVFFFGLEIGELVEVRIPVGNSIEENIYPPSPVSPIRKPSPQRKFSTGLEPDPYHRKSLCDDKSLGLGDVVLSIKLTRVGPLQSQGIRTLVFELNGKEQKHSVVDERLKPKTKKVSLPLADPTDPHQIASNLPGTIENILKHEGDTVSKGTVLMKIMAMKMEVEITAAFDCIITQICVTNNCQVDVGTLLARVQQTSPIDVPIHRCMSTLTQQPRTSLTKIKKGDQSSLFGDTMELVRFHIEDFIRNNLMSTSK